MTGSTSSPPSSTAAWGRKSSIAAARARYGEWAVAAVYEDADLVRQIHSDYIRAGADVITANTYGTTRVSPAPRRH